MSDLEQRLRAAMRAAVAEEQPPADLLEMVRMRRRRHRARAAAAAAGVAVVTAAAVTALGLHAGPFRAPAALPGRAPSSRPSAPALMPPVGSRTVVDSCAMQIGAVLPHGWQRQSVQAGQVWLVGLRQEFTSPVNGSTVRIGGLMVMVPYGVTAWVTVVGQADSYFRFLFGPGDFAKGVDGRYTIHDGEGSVTFQACPSGRASTYGPGFTQYGGYFLVTVPRPCVTLDVWTATGGTRNRVTFGVDGARCPRN